MFRGKRKRREISIGDRKGVEEVKRGLGQVAWSGHGVVL